MKIVVQRVKRASVTNKSIHNQIEKGYCLLVGVGKNSTEADIEVLAKKIVNARLFEDENGKLNLNIQQINGAILSISQFTLYAEVKKVIDQVSHNPCDLKMPKYYTISLTLNFKSMILIFKLVNLGQIWT